MMIYRTRLAEELLVCLLAYDFEIEDDEVVAGGDGEDVQKLDAMLGEWLLSLQDTEQASWMMNIRK